MRVVEKVYLIDSFKFPGIFSTYFLDFDKKVLIDPCVMNGTQIILDYLSSLGVNRLDYIALTHVHLDHMGGAAKLAKILGGEILVHPKGVKHVVNPEKLWSISKSLMGERAEIYGKPESIDESKVLRVEDGEVFDLGDEELLCIHAPGHASHMVAFFLRNAKILFPSDAVGIYYSEKTFPVAPSPFNYKEAIFTLEKLGRLNPNKIALTHFGVAGKFCISEAGERLKFWFKLARKAETIEELIFMIKNNDPDFSILRESPLLSFLQEIERFEEPLCHFSFWLEGLFREAKKSN